jgi:hypothetical protein
MRRRRCPANEALASRVRFATPRTVRIVLASSLLLLFGCDRVFGISPGILDEGDASVDASHDTSVDDARDVGAESPDGVVPKADTAVVDDTAVGRDVAVDTRPVFACNAPAGTTVAEMRPPKPHIGSPEGTLDGNTGSLWNAGATSAYVKYAFPSARRIGAVRIAGNASPPGQRETFTVYGFKDGVQTAIGVKTIPVRGDLPCAWVEPISVADDTYEAIAIEIEAAPSWVALCEVAFGESVAACTE